MKFLVDQNLPLSILATLSPTFPGSRHVSDYGMSSAPDDEIWNFAKENGFVIISKDSDFNHRAFLFGHPPKVLWLKVGSASTQAIKNIIDSHIAELVEFLADKQSSLLVLSMGKNARALSVLR